MAKPNVDRQQRIAAWYKADERRTVPQAARLFQVSYETVVAALDATDTARRPHPNPNADRDQKILAKLAEGMTLAAVGTQHKLSRQRIHQIRNRLGA